MRPRLSKASVRIVPLAPWPGLNVLSTVPSEFNRAMRVRVDPFTVVKSPAMRILSSGCTRTA